MKFPMGLVRKFKNNINIYIFLYIFRIKSFVFVSIVLQDLEICVNFWTWTNKNVRDYGFKEKVADWQEWIYWLWINILLDRGCNSVSDRDSKDLWAGNYFRDE